MTETKVGEVFQFFQKASVAAIRVTEGVLKTGDRIHILGNTTDFAQEVGSMQVKQTPLLEAKKGEEVGIQVSNRVRPNDIVYKVE